MWLEKRCWTAKVTVLAFFNSHFWISRIHYKFAFRFNQDKKFELVAFFVFHKYDRWMGDKLQFESCLNKEKWDPIPSLEFIFELLGRMCWISIEICITKGSFRTLNWLLQLYSKWYIIFSCFYPWLLACTETRNAGMPECRNAGILKPGTQNY